MEIHLYGKARPAKPVRQNPIRIRIRQPYDCIVIYTHTTKNSNHLPDGVRMGNRISGNTYKYHMRDFAGEVSPYEWISSLIHRTSANEHHCKISRTIEQYRDEGMWYLLSTNCRRRRVVIRQKGSDGINRASEELGNELRASPGDVVHIKCRKDYVVTFYIERDKVSVENEYSNVQFSMRSNRIMITTHLSVHAAFEQGFLLLLFGIIYLG